MHMMQDLQNCYVYYVNHLAFVGCTCLQRQTLQEYEEQLLEKCFDRQYDNLQLGETQAYVPPFIYTNEMI